MIITACVVSRSKVNIHSLMSVSDPRFINEYFPPPPKKKKLPSLVDCVLKNYPPKKLNKHTDMINSSIVFVLDCITNLPMQITIEYYFPKLPEKIQKIIYSSIILVTTHLKNLSHKKFL